MIPLFKPTVCAIIAKELDCLFDQDPQYSNIGVTYYSNHNFS